MKEKLGLQDKLTLTHMRGDKVIGRRVTATSTLQKLIKHTPLGACLMDDLVMNYAKADIALYLANTYLYMGIGDDDGSILPLAATNTTLGHQVQRLASTNDRVMTNVANDTARFQRTFTFTVDTFICEAGQLKTLSGSDLMCRQLFEGSTFKAPNDRLLAEWQVVVT